MEIPVLPPTDRVVDSVRTALREAILEGRLSPGQRLSVPELARQLNVSRSPVREAILQLVGEGLAVERSRKGVVVASPSVSDLGEIMELRGTLKGMAAGLCARRASPEILEALAETLEFQSRAIQEKNIYLYSDTNTRFHELIAEGCGNAHLARFLGMLFAEMRLAFSALAANPAHTMRGYQEHQAVLEAIQNRDPATAQAVMLRHIINTQGEINRLVRKSGKASEVEVVG